MAVPSTYYVKSTTAAPIATQTNFSLVFDLANITSADWWGDCDTADATKGQVYSADGLTRYACDFIDFNTTNETGLVRFLVPSWSGATEFRFYPPNSGNASAAAASTYGSDNAYDANWEGYWPLGGDFNDRTSNGNDGTGGGGIATPAAVTGAPFGNAATFDGTDDYIDVGSPSISGSDATIVAWLKSDNDPPASQPATGLGQFGEKPVNSGATHYTWTDGVIYSSILRGTSGTTTSRYTVGNITTALDQWNHLVVRNDSDNGGVGYQVWLNASKEYQSAENTTLYVGDYWRLGRSDGSASVYWYDGAAAEFQVHSTDRSDDWISDEYDQTNANSTFWSAPNIHQDGGTETSPLLLMRRRLVAA